MNQLIYQRTSWMVNYPWIGKKFKHKAQLNIQFKCVGEKTQMQVFQGYGRSPRMARAEARRSAKTASPFNSTLSYGSTNATDAFLETGLNINRTTDQPSITTQRITR